MAIFHSPAVLKLIACKDVPSLLYSHSQTSPERRGSGDVQLITSGFIAKYIVYCIHKLPAEE